MKESVRCYKVDKPIEIRFRLPEVGISDDGTDALGDVFRAVELAVQEENGDSPFLWQSSGGPNGDYTFCVVDEDDCKTVLEALTAIGCTSIETNGKPEPGRRGDGQEPGVYLLHEEDNGGWYFVLYN